MSDLVRQAPVRDRVLSYDVCGEGSIRSLFFFRHDFVRSWVAVSFGSPRGLSITRQEVTSANSAFGQCCARRKKKK